MNESVKKLLKEESWRQILSSLVVCFFARKIYDPETVIKTLEVAGISMTKEDLDRLGQEILVLKNKLKAREGFNPDELRIPDRVFETPSARGQIEKKVVTNAIQEYYRLLYNLEN
jgi:aldehyde:ferredoxin oxidoreductase